MPKNKAAIIAFWKPLRDSDGLPIMPSCENCSDLSSDDVCSRFERYEHLKSFPFKSPMQCFMPNFWTTEFVNTMSTREVNGKYNEHCRPGSARLFFDFLRSHGMQNGYVEDTHGNA